MADTAPHWSEVAVLMLTLPAIILFVLGVAAGTMGYRLLEWTVPVALLMWVAAGYIAREQNHA